MLLSLRKNGLTSLFKEVRVFKVVTYFRTLSSQPTSKMSGKPNKGRFINLCLCRAFRSFSTGSPMSEQLPCRSAQVKIFSVFLCRRCREIWREILGWKFPRYVFQGLGVRGKISLKFHFKNGAKNRKFHANFTGRSADQCTKGSRTQLQFGTPSSKVCHSGLLWFGLLERLLIWAAHCEKAQRGGGGIAPNWSCWAATTP